MAAKTKASTKQGKKQLNLPGRAKKPLSPNYGEKPMAAKKSKSAAKSSRMC